MSSFCQQKIIYCKRRAKQRPFAGCPPVIPVALGRPALQGPALLRAPRKTVAAGTGEYVTA